MNYIDIIFASIVNRPIEFAFAVSILSGTLYVFVKLVSNPLESVIALFSNILTSVIKELTGKAGIAGLINLITCICTFGICFVLAVKGTITSLFVSEIKSDIIFFLFFAISIISALICVYYVSECDRPYSKNKGEDKQ